MAAALFHCGQQELYGEAGLEMMSARPSATQTCPCCAACGHTCWQECGRSRPASLPGALLTIKNRADAVGLPFSDQSLLLEMFGAIRQRCKARPARAKHSSTGDAQGLSPCWGIAVLAATCAHGGRQPQPLPAGGGPASIATCPVCTINPIFKP